MLFLINKLLKEINKEKNKNAVTFFDSEKSNKGKQQKKEK
jgi:hypothetical protein